MDYEKKYKEALQRAKDFENGEVHYAINKGENIMHWIFPELRESEDERIRKAIKKALQVRCDGSRIISDEPVTLEEAIAWLEKQGEQKPTWSDEDERNLEGIIDEIEANKNNAPDYDLATYDRFLSWLKSLKDRYTWKPSEEQMEAIKDAIEFLGCTKKVREDLKSLYEQLKKLC